MGRVVEKKLHRATQQQLGTSREKKGMSHQSRLSIFQWMCFSPDCNLYVLCGGVLFRKSQSIWPSDSKLAWTVLRNLGLLNLSQGWAFAQSKSRSRKYLNSLVPGKKNQENVWWAGSGFKELINSMNVRLFLFSTFTCMSNNSQLKVTRSSKDEW